MFVVQGYTRVFMLKTRAICWAYMQHTICYILYQKILNLRKFFTDCFEILTQRCIRIRVRFYIWDGTGWD
jgi:hypothetical protein